MTTRPPFSDFFLNLTFRFNNFVVAVMFILAGTTATIQAATIVVPAGGDLQSAINIAQPGDTIIIEAGATFVGPFHLPDKGAGTSYITIQSSALTNMPGGVRVGPANAANMPKLVSSGAGIYGVVGQPVIWTLGSAHHWKLQGLEITQTNESSTATSLVLLESQTGQGPGNTATIPHHISIDRCYIHSLGTGNTWTVRGIALNSKDSEVIDSYIANIHGNSTDSQAIFAWNTPGNLVIRNNYLEATSECLQIGSTDASGITPDNISVTRNHLSRPLAWKSADAAYNNYRNIKANFETKGCTNCVLDGNVFENNWADGQVGYAIVISSWFNNIHNFTFTNNLIRHVGAGISISSHDVGGTCTNINISNNLIEDIDPVVYGSIFGGNAAGLFLAVGPSDYVTVNHNTTTDGGVGVSNNDYVISPHFTFTNNIIGSGGVGTWPIMRTIPQNSGTLQKTVVVGGAGNHDGTEDLYAYRDYAPVPPVPAFPQSTLYPSLNGTMLWFTENFSQVGFVNPAAGNYRLSSVSPYKGRGTDTRDIGCDIDALEAAIGGTAPPSPTPTPTPVPSPTPTPNPTPPPTPTPTPGPAPSETVWVEDSLPAGATAATLGDPWNWVSGSPSPYSGALASQSTLQSGMHQYYFSGATASLTINSGDTMVAYVFIDPSNVPNQIMLQWYDGDWEQRAYWGANNISIGTDNTDSRRHMGPIPAAGQWVRLEVPASQVGLANKTINGMAFTLHGGRATWDRAGKTSQAQSTQLGESILRAKRGGQNLANQVASSGGGSNSGSSNALQVNLAEQVALDLFIVEIQQAYAHFNANPAIYPAASRIDIELAGALQRALQANQSFAQNDIAGFRNHLRQAIGHLELSGVLIAHPNVANPIDVASYVVRQHYVDFFDREPELSGNEFWVNQFSACGTNAQCFDDRRIHVSAAFFLSIEFQQTGYFVHRLYKSSYGRVPSFLEFMPDNSVIGQGVVVGTAGWEARLAANKDQFLQSWVQRADFVARYASLTNEQYVDALIFNLGVAIDPAERDKLILDLANGWSRANVLGHLSQNAAFSRSEFNSAFVLMQYFGYLRRDPDSAGFNFWLNKLNQFDGNYQSADMVKAFLASQEYRVRFAL